MSAEIHCERQQQDRGEQSQQGGVEADSNFTPLDFPENPGAQPYQAYKNCRARNQQSAVQRRFPDLSSPDLAAHVSLIRLLHQKIEDLQIRRQIGSKQDSHVQKGMILFRVILCIGRFVLTMNYQATSMAFSVPEMILLKWMGVFKPRIEVMDPYLKYKCRYKWPTHPTPIKSRESIGRLRIELLVLSSMWCSQKISLLAAQLRV